MVNVEDSKLADDVDYVDVIPPEYQCLDCVALFVPISAHYACPNCGKPSSVKVLMTKSRTDLNGSLSEQIKSFEDEEAKIYTSDSEFPNFILEQVEKMIFTKKHFGTFFQKIRCGTFLTLSIRDLRYGGYVPQFIEFNLWWFYDFFEYNKYADINKAIEDYFEAQDYEEFEYLKENFKDVILAVYEYYKKDRRLRKRSIIRPMLQRLQEKMIKMAIKNRRGGY